jgi:hypothetical protein
LRLGVTVGGQRADFAKACDVIARIHAHFPEVTLLHWNSFPPTLTLRS